MTHSERENRCTPRKHVKKKDETFCDCGALMIGPTGPDAHVGSEKRGESMTSPQFTPEQLTLLQAALTTPTCWTP